MALSTRRSEGVRARAHPSFGPTDVVLDDARHAPDGEAAAARVQEDGALIAPAVGGPLATVGLERRERGCTDRYDAFLPPLAEHADHLAAAVDVAPVELHELAYADAGRVQ